MKASENVYNHQSSLSSSQKGPKNYRETVLLKAKILESFTTRLGVMSIKITPV
jgi:hypothetical protein